MQNCGRLDESKIDKYPSFMSYHNLISKAIMPMMPKNSMSRKIAKPPTPKPILISLWIWKVKRRSAG